MPVVHEDDIAVDLLAKAMKERLAEKRAEGKGGWQNADAFPAEVCSEKVWHHLYFGGVLDAINYLMFLQQRNEPLSPPTEDAFMAYGIKALTTFCHKRSYDAGWWHVALPDGTSIDMAAATDHPFYPYFIATKMMLTVSEVAEEMEGFRKDLEDDHLPEYTQEACEMTDELIRIFDRAGARGIDLVPIFFAKTNYNAVREDHKAEARAKKGGKKF